ncbi:MAG: hypothetical protein O2871_01265 [bacterium]|nr:hypothetical protein [bacterium]
MEIITKNNTEKELNAKKVLEKIKQQLESFEMVYLGKTNFA